ncbi:MAG: ATP synthase F1 subunit delta [Thermoguttaceae bacterium]
MSNPEQDAQFSAEWNADVTVEKIAEMYANAFLDAAEGQSTPVAEQIELFDSLLSDVFAKNPNFEAVLNSALVSPDDKISLLDKTLKSQAAPMFLNFLKVVAKHGRLDILRDIHREVHISQNRRMGRIPVQITTAVEMDSETRNSLAVSLKKLIGGEPIFQTQVDPEVIGGIIVRVGDTIYDASLLTQLKTVRQQMIDRSAHEIQSRRDRFSNTEGN